MTDMSLVKKIFTEDKKEFFAQHIFHERQMNSCPIGCEGCAVSAVTNAKGSINYSDLKDFYSQAEEQGVSLKITKVEGYDPVFVNYQDDAEVPFAQTVKDAIDHGHQIITPVCTTGSWKSERTKWQLKELGKLDSKYREYRYPSGNSGCGFVLSVPREIRPFENGRYDFDAHVAKVIEDLELLSQNGEVEALIYYNSQFESDYDTAVRLKANVAVELSENARKNSKLEITNFNCETLPESCYRYPNSVLVSDKGFTLIDSKKLEWTEDPNLVEFSELPKKLAGIS